MEVLGGRAESRAEGHKGHRRALHIGGLALLVACTGPLALGCEVTSDLDGDDTDSPMEDSDPGTQPGSDTGSPTDGTEGETPDGMDDVDMTTSASTPAGGVNAPVPTAAEVTCDTTQNVPLNIEGCTEVIPGHFFVSIAAGYTGEFSYQGPTIERGIITLINEVNEVSGGIAGGKCVGALRCDTAGNASGIKEILEAQEGQERLLGNFGSIRTSAAPEVAPAVKATGKPFLTHRGEPAELAEEHGGHWFSIAISNEDSAAILAESIASGNEGTKFGVMLASDPGLDFLGRAVHARMTELIAEGDTTFESAELYNISTFDELVLPQADGVDVLFSIVDVVRAGELLVASSALAYQPLIYNMNGWSLLLEADASEVQLMPDRLRFATTGDAGPYFGAYEARYRAEWNEDPEPNLANTYDATCVMLLSAEVADDPLDSAEITQGLHSVLAGGEVTTGCPASLQAIRDGATSVTYSGAGPFSRFNDTNTSASATSSLMRLNAAGDTMEIFQCYDPNPEQLPVCGS